MIRAIYARLTRKAHTGKGVKEQLCPRLTAFFMIQFIYVAEYFKHASGHKAVHAAVISLKRMMTFVGTVVYHVTICCLFDRRAFFVGNSKIALDGAKRLNFIKESYRKLHRNACDAFDIVILDAEKLRM